jgi:hypothetical protein
MEKQILGQAAGYDLTETRAAIDTILTAGRVEVELNRASQLAKFQVRDSRDRFTNEINAAESEAGVTEIIESARREVDEFEAQLN